MIYKDPLKIPTVEIIREDCLNIIPKLVNAYNVIIVTDPPFNIGYHYNTYVDKIDDREYYKMLAHLITCFSSVIIHYPENLYKLSVEAGIVPKRVVSWVYNSNTGRQHRDIAFYGVNPNFNNVKQPYKNLNDKRIKERIKNGKVGAKLYDWWNVNQVKNVSKEKTEHPCQMPLEVMKNIVALLPADSVIFDPFTGSGTTAIACLELGYDFIGCEIDTRYYQIAKERIENKKIELKERGVI